MTRVLLFGAGVAMLMLAVSPQRASPVRLHRLAPFGLADTLRSKRESTMEQALASPRITRNGLSCLRELVGAIASTVVAEQALALRAAETATLHRRKLAELRAMYVQSLDR